jgi:hypothetical protein
MEVPNEIQDEIQKLVEVLDLNELDDLIKNKQTEDSSLTGEFVHLPFEADNKFSDFTIIVDGREFKVNKGNLVKNEM